MAIEMSLQNSPNPAHRKDDSSPPETAKSFGELPTAESVANALACTSEYSTVVTRVPNKSVEDLNRDTLRSDRAFPDPLGACGGLPDLTNQRAPFGPHDFHHGAASASSSYGKGKASTFGVIKDLSANNLFANDANKTKDFDKKDFSQIYVKSNLPDLSAMEEKVFEPRPPYPAGDEEHSLARKLHLGLSGSEDEDEVHKDQVWKERKPSTGSDRSFSGSPPMLSHSPRFTVDHALSTLPDIIDTHLDRHRKASPSILETGGAIPSSADPYYNKHSQQQQRGDHLVSAFDEDDPGPHLDAVLRSLSKLTARLGDQDDFFLDPVGEAGDMTSSLPPPSAVEEDGNSEISQHELTPVEQCDLSASAIEVRSDDGQVQEESEERFFDADNDVHRHSSTPPPPPPLTSDLDDLEDQGEHSVGLDHSQQGEVDQEGAVYV